MELQALVSWPSAPLTERLVKKALEQLIVPLHTINSLPPNTNDPKPLLQWCTYDAMDHELTLKYPSTVLSSSYTIRKALIRKHFLHRCIHAYTTKHEESILRNGSPRTWDIEISFADELDDMWTDELWDLAELLESRNKWFILKPGMADRGMGIRLFNSKQALQKIFEEFDGNSDEEDDEDENTNVVTSQLRHFVIQEYLSDPVLVDPRKCSLLSEAVHNSDNSLRGHKFHLRAYCVASGSLKVFLYEHILALFSSMPYQEPFQAADTSSVMDLRPHLTNTCLQEGQDEGNVRLLQELIGSSVLSSPHEKAAITQEDVSNIMKQMEDILRETFTAALQMPVHFQPLPNAFELFGVDFLVCHEAPTKPEGPRFSLKLLEINAEPAIEMTGPRLRWILEDLFTAACEACVAPFFTAFAERLERLRMCLDIRLHKEC